MLQILFIFFIFKLKSLSISLLSKYLDVSHSAHVHFFVWPGELLILLGARREYTNIFKIKKTYLSHNNNMLQLVEVKVWSPEKKTSLSFLGIFYEVFLNWIILDNNQKKAKILRWPERHYQVSESYERRVRIGKEADDHVAVQNCHGRLLLVLEKVWFGITEEISQIIESEKRFTFYELFPLCSRNFSVHFINYSKFNCFQGIQSKIFKYSLTMTQSSMARAGVQWNIPVLSYLIKAKHE